MLKTNLIRLATCLIVISCVSCGHKYEPGSPDSIEINPYGNAPLSAMFVSSVEGKVSVQVEGKENDGITVKKTFNNVTEGDTIPILGLYPEYANQVKIIEIPTKGTRKKTEVVLHTDSLPHHPVIEIDNITKGKCSDLMISFCHFRARDRYCLLFDNTGEIRWYLEAQVKNMLFKRLRDGNIIYFDTSPNKNKFAVYNPIGKLMCSGAVEDYNGASYSKFHHDILELGNGHLIVPMHKKEPDGSIKQESVLIEIDTDGNVYNEWDFDEIFLELLKEENDATPDNVTDSCAFVVKNEDWLHINSIDFQESDSSFILSSQRWFIFKVGMNDKKIKWIIGDDTREWYTRFPTLRKYALKNINNNEYDPPRGQHTVRLLPNGRLLFFNNGYSDVYKGGPHESKAFDHNYSSACEYEIDEENFTYKQIWQYGKEAGVDLYSFITSNVEQLENGNRFISFNSIRTPERNKYKPIKIVELKNDKVVFSATVHVDPVKFTYQNTRESLYP